MGNDGRDVKIVEMSRSGMTYRQIGDEFGLSSARVGKIVIDDWNRRRLMSDELFVALERSANELGRGASLLTRTYNCLKRNGVHTLLQVAAMPDERLLDMRGLGRNCIEIVMFLKHGYGGMELATCAGSVPTRA